MGVFCMWVADSVRNWVRTRLASCGTADASCQSAALSATGSGMWEKKAGFWLRGFGGTGIVGVWWIAVVVVLEIRSIGGFLQYSNMYTEVLCGKHAGMYRYTC